MDANRQKEIASKGGRAAHAKGTAHQFTSEEAREAGRKGGQAVSRNREHMAAIGRESGQSRGKARERNNSGNLSSLASNSTGSSNTSNDNRNVGDQSQSRFASTTEASEIRDRE